MKKLQLFTLAAATLLTLGGLAGCGNKTSDSDNKVPGDTTQPDGGETKPDGGETKPDGGETKPDGGETKPDGGETKPDGGETKPEEIVQEQLEIAITDEKQDYHVGQKAHIEFRVGGKKLANKDKLCGKDSGFKVTYSIADAAKLNEGEDYVVFSKAGRITITVESKYYKKATVTFTVKEREYVAGKTNLVISGPAAQTSFMEKVAAKYNDTLPANKKVNFIFEDHGEDKVDSEVLDWTKGPDIFAFASDKISELYKKGALAAIRNTNAEFLETTMTDGALEAAAFPTAGNYLAYPYAGDNGYYLFYNKADVTEAQTATIEGLLDLAVSKGKKVAYPLNTAFYSAGALFTYGARYSMKYDQNGKLAGVTADFDSDKGIKAGKAILKIMTHKGYREEQAAPTADSGLIACVDGSWNAAAYKEKLGENFACTKLPTVSVDGDVKNLSSFLGYKLYGVNNTIEDPEQQKAAHEFAKFLTSKEIQEFRFKELSIAPTNIEAIELPEVQNDPAVKAINTQSKFAVAQTAVPANVWSAPQVFTQAIIEKKVTEANIAEYMTVLNNSIKASK